MISIEKKNLLALELDKEYVGVNAIKIIIDYIEQENPTQDSKGRYLDIDGNFLINNLLPDRENILYYAIKNKDGVLFKWLLEQGADINHGHDGLSLLHIAAKVGYLKVIQYLLNRGYNINQRAGRINSVNGTISEYFTPLHMAIRFGQIEAVGLLFSLGANLNIDNPPVDTPDSNALNYAEHLLSALDDNAESDIPIAIEF